MPGVKFYAANRVIRNAETTKGQLHQCAIRAEVLVVDQGSQAHRAVVSGFDHFLFLHRWPLRHDDSPGVADSARRPPAIEYLQQGLHSARHHNDLFLPHPVDTGDLGKLPDPNDDRSKRSRLSPHKPVELVHLSGRRHHHDLRVARGRCRYRLDLLHAVQHHVFKFVCRRDWFRNLCHRLLVHPDRTQLHRHGSHDARARHDVVSHAAVYLVNVRDQPGHDSRHSGDRDHDPASGL